MKKILYYFGAVIVLVILYSFYRKKKTVKVLRQTLLTDNTGQFPKMLNTGDKIIVFLPKDSKLFNLLQTQHYYTLIDGVKYVVPEYVWNNNERYLTTSVYSQ